MKPFFILLFMLLFIVSCGSDSQSSPLLTNATNSTSENTKTIFFSNAEMNTSMTYNGLPLPAVHLVITNNRDETFTGYVACPLYSSYQWDVFAIFLPSRTSLDIFFINGNWDSGPQAFNVFLYKGSPSAETTQSLTDSEYNVWRSSHTLLDDANVSNILFH